jgi:hypothetical protein
LAASSSTDSTGVPGATIFANDIQRYAEMDGLAAFLATANPNLPPADTIPFAECAERIAAAHRLLDQMMEANTLTPVA